MINISIFRTKMTALNLLTDLKKAHGEGVKQKQRQNLGNRRWQVPPRGWVKINVNTPDNLGMKFIGIGSVLSDDDERFLQVPAW